MISDAEFVTTIEYLIKVQIMALPGAGGSGDAAEPNAPEDSGVPDSVIIIPDWIKLSAGWWSDEMISDAEFVTAIEWMIANGLIRL